MMAAIDARPLAPTDAQADAAWEKIMGIAREHCLIVQAAGGTATLATPHAQRQAEIRDQVLRMHCRSEP